MRKHQIGVYDIQQLLCCSEKTVRNKLTGTTDFTYQEVKKIRDTFFPGMMIDYLFEDSEKHEAS